MVWPLMCTRFMFIPCKVRRRVAGTLFHVVTETHRDRQRVPKFSSRVIYWETLLHTLGFKRIPGAVNFFVIIHRGIINGILFCAHPYTTEETTTTELYSVIITTVVATTTARSCKSHDIGDKRWWMGWKVGVVVLLLLLCSIQEMDRMCSPRE